MNEPSTQSDSILSCIDGSIVSEPVCDYSTWVAQMTKTPLLFLHTISHQQSPPVADLSGAIGLGASEELLNELTDVEQDRNRLLIKKGKLMLEAAQQKAMDAGATDVDIIQQHGSFVETLISMEQQIGLLVMGIRGRNHDETQTGLGNHLESVIRSLHRPILVVNNTFQAPQNIMLAYDGSEPAKKALEYIANSPLFKTLPCHLVYVAPNEKAPAQLLSEAALKLSNVGINLTTAKLFGKIDEALSSYQSKHQIDLIAMGAFSHNRIRDFLFGSFTVKMLENTQRPLLLIR